MKTPGFSSLIKNVSLLCAAAFALTFVSFQGALAATKKKAAKTAEAVPSPTPDPYAITLEAAVAQAMEYSQDVKKAESQIKGAKDATAKARGALFPTINGVAAATNTQNATTITTGSVGGFVSSNGDLYQVGLTLMQPLYAGGALTAGLNLYKAGEDLAQQNYFNVKQTVTAAIVGAYYSLAQSEEMLDAAESNRDILKSYVDITTHYENIGRSRLMDKLQARVNFSLALSDVEAGGNNNRTAMANLNRLLGQANDRPIRTNFKARINPISPIELEQAYQAGLKNNPVIKAAQIVSEQVNYTRDVDLALDKPSLTLNATDGYRSPDTTTLWNSSSNYYSIGLNLTVPIFSGFSSFAKRSAYGEQEYQTQRDLQNAKDTLRSTIQIALSSLKSAQTQLDLTQNSVKEGREALDIANRSFRQGIASSLDVVTMQTTRYNAEKTFINAEFAYLSALLSLRQQMGIDLEKAYVHP